jgi:hypothetical protein
MNLKLQFRPRILFLFFPSVSSIHHFEKGKVCWESKCCIGSLVDFMASIHCWEGSLLTILVLFFFANSSSNPFRIAKLTRTTYELCQFQTDNHFWRSWSYFGVTCIMNSFLTSFLQKISATIVRVEVNGVDEQFHLLFIEKSCVDDQ